MRQRLVAPVAALSLMMSLTIASAGSAIAQPADPDDLLFTQYIEGSSFNKALEVGNLTGEAVDLDAGDYHLVGYHNGNTSPTYEVALTGTLDADAAWVFADSQADTALADVADHERGGLWNGDDALVLYRDYDPSTGDGTVLDSIGQVGTDPGSSWGSGTTTTQNATLCPVEGRVSGDTDPSDVYDPVDDWVGFPTDTFGGIGDPNACGPDEEPIDGTVFISEFHYDNDGGDTGEFVEVTGPAGTDLSGWAVHLYNGNGGGTYDAESLSGTLSDQAAGYGTVVVAPSSIQNGAPDGIALTDATGEVVEFLSYEGELTATGGPAEGQEARDVGVSQGSSTPEGASIERVGDVPDGWEWVSTDTNSRGAPNPGSTIDGVEIPAVEPPPEPECDATDITLVSTVQGDGDTSPLTGDPVYVPGDPITVRAAVTLIAPELDGYFVQEEPDDQDDDPATSEGVFVEGSAPADAQLGDTVEVTGGVSEEFDRTQINADEVALCDVDPVEIEPTPLELPADDAERERHEGMLVATAQDLYVSSLFTAYDFGELGVALDGPLTQPTAAYAPDDPRAQELAEANAEELLFINDRDEFGGQNAPWFDDVRRRAGDIVEAGAVGALNFSFGDFLLEPVGAFPEIVQVEERPDAPRLDEGNDIGAFNVLNYFNTFGDSSVLRGARSQEQFDLQSAKIVEAINALDAAVLGLIELENDYEDHYDGDPDTEPSVKTLVDELNDAAGEQRWDWVVPDEDDLTDEGLGGGGVGTDAIAQGIIYQPDRATEVGDPATFDIDAQLTGEDADKNRWPFAQSFELDGEVVTVVVNHFKSKGSSCENVAGPDFDLGDDVETDLTANCNLTREYAAERIMEWVETKPTGVDSPDTFVVGDLNAYQQEGPVQRFLEAGYEDAVATRGDDAFTYKFDGRYGRLDHILASPSAKRLLDDAAVWQANSPEPYGYLYYLEPVETVEDATAYASSDHDPVVASLDPPRRSGHGSPDHAGGGKPGSGPPWGDNHQVGSPGSAAWGGPAAFGWYLRGWLR